MSHFFGVLIPSYFLVQSLTLVIVFIFVASRAKRMGFDRVKALDTSLFVILSGWVGARLLHVVWEAPAFYEQHPLAILNLTSGGFVYDGGLWVGMLVGWSLISKSPSKSPGEWADFYAPAVALGTGLGRIGCLFAGCCYGTQCQLPWAVAGRHPVPLYLLLLELIAFVLLLRFEEKRPPFLKKPGSLFIAWMVFHGVGRFLSEFLRDDDRGPTLLGFSLAQSLALVLVTVAVIIWKKGSFKSA